MALQWTVLEPPMCTPQQRFERKATHHQYVLFIGRYFDGLAPVYSVSCEDALRNVLIYRNEASTLKEAKAQAEEWMIDLEDPPARSIHFRSDSDLWETPQALFDELNAEFHFTVDVCALPHNAKLPRYYSPEQDGLRQDWSGEVAWCNPPYGRAIAGWVQKAYEASKAGATVVCLLPARCDTRWWHSYCLPYAEIRYLPGRLKFGGCDNSAPFPSAVVVFRPVPRVTEEH
jgi:phage N-6-adenine-methyltransferase